MADQADLFGRSLVSAEEEHLFRRWRSELGSMEKIAAEYGKTEAQMLGIIAGIWRRLSIGAHSERPRSF